MPILAPALLTMVAAQLLDLGTFLTMIRRMGISAEANPLVLGFFQDGGLPVLVIAKILLVVLIGAVVVALVASRRVGLARAGWAVLAFAIVAGVFGGWTNAITMGPL